MTRDWSRAPPAMMRGHDPRRESSSRCLIRSASFASCSAMRCDIRSSSEAPEREAAFDGNEPQRFCADYAKAGGSIALEYIDMERKAGSSPDLAKCGPMFGRMVEFVEQHVRV